MSTIENFMPAFKTPEELQAHQLKGLQWTVAHAYNGSPEYRKKLDGAGVGPEDIRNLGDLQRLPFTTADDLRDGYPFPLRCVPFEKIVRIHSSSGTTGDQLHSPTHAPWTSTMASARREGGKEDGRIGIGVGSVGFEWIAWSGCEMIGGTWLARMKLDLDTTSVYAER